MGELENGYTFRMGDHEVTMRDSFSSMFDQKQLTDCLLVCPQNNRGPHNAANSAAANGDTSESTDNCKTQLTNGHNSGAKSGARNEWSGNRLIKTHRVILSASSDFFRSIFASLNNSLANNGVVAVVINNVDFDDLDAIVEFIYKGQVSVGQSRIHKFLAAAQFLSVKGLMNIKLVSNDNTPIEETNAHDIEINKLKNDKRLLELELKALKDNEKQKIDRIRHEVDEEMKKFELEKKSFNEAKRKFEVERYKLSVERDNYDKNKHLRQNESTDRHEPNRQLSQTEKSSTAETSRNNDDVSKSETYVNNAEHRVVSRDSPTKNSSPNGVRLSVGQQTTSASLLSQRSPSLESNQQKTLSAEDTESEGRQLRKRVRTPGQDETADSPRKNTKSELQKIDEDDGGEIYEIDFSNYAQQSDGRIVESSVGEARQRFSAALTTTSATPSSRAIVASTVAYLATPTTATTVPSKVNNTRILRRSTSSHGSASAQSNVGENGNDFSAANDGTPSTPQRRKGPGRTPTWMKDKLEGAPQPKPPQPQSTEPLKRGRKPRVSDQEFGRTSGTLYQCPYCPQVYHGNQSMQDHINGVHLNSGQKYICDYCGKVYTWRISLNKHLKTVHPNEDNVS